MRKIFTYLMATACVAFVAATAEAASLESALSTTGKSVSLDKKKMDKVGKEISLDRKGKKNGNGNFSKIENARMDAAVISAKKVRSNAPVDGSSIDGAWIFTLGDYYFGSFGYYDAVNWTFNATYIAEDGFVLFEDPQQYVQPFVGELDVTTGKLSFFRGYLGNAPYPDYGMVYFYQQPYIYDWDTDDISPADVVADYNEEEGTLTFPADRGMAWEVYSTQSDTEASFLGYYDIFDLEGAVKDIPYVDDPSEWKDLGNALLMDGWVLPAFGIDQTDPANWYEVPLQQNKNNQYLYRLVNPYKVGPAAEFNEYDGDGWIEFDVENPECVLVNENGIPSGFANADLGITEHYCFNYVVFYARYWDFSTDRIYDSMGDVIPITTFKDGVVTLGSYDDPDYGLDYDANFGHQYDKDGGYVWTDYDDNKMDMSASITFPGYFTPSAVESVIRDKEAGAAVYFDINGVRVDNPAKGGIYIVKRGAEVSKVVIR